MKRIGDSKHSIQYFKCRNKRSHEGSKTAPKRLSARSLDRESNEMEYLEDKPLQRGPSLLCREGQALLVHLDLNSC